MKIVAEEHWVKKGPVRLYVYRKHDVEGAASKPVLFLVHGSTFSSRGTYDLMVEGKGDYSAIEHFAGLGYDVWTMDHEGYGFSDRTDSNSGIMVGVADLKAAMPLVLDKSGRKAIFLFGESSGAIKAGAYANEEPETVERLMLHALTYTGKDAPEMDRRRRMADQFRANPQRPFGKAQIDNVFNRDKSGQTDPSVIAALSEFELKFGDSVPCGTYLDMALHLPMVDPTKINCSVAVSRPDHDGNSTEEELFEFFVKLASRDKQYILMRGLPHGGGMVGYQRHRMWHVMHSFFGAPAAPME
ncbi:MAG: alpha/beta hydrolase [Hyphomicrobiaceae bacterium]